MSITFFQCSSVNLIERLSKVMPALFTKASILPSSEWQESIKFSIAECWSSLNDFVLIFLNSFFSLFNLSSLVPVAKTSEPNS